MPSGRRSEAMAAKMERTRKICSVIGTRPQFIKAAAVSRALVSRPELTEVLVHTGQHYDGNMSEVFFLELALPTPHYHLGIGSGSHAEQTGRMLTALEAVLTEERPDLVLVYGDTNSTLAGALAAAKLHIPVAHVEAGLRSGNRRMPEEINRIIADHLADLLFAPTETALANLRREGLGERGLHLVGDVMYDAALYYAAKAESKREILRRLGLTPRGYVLATIHRAENTDDPERLRAIFGGLDMTAAGIPVVVPLHPRTGKALREAGFAPTHAGLRLIEPVGYLEMVCLEKNARLIATDSGGVQKEAFFHRVPCATLREETEWVELLELGWNRLVPPRSAEAVRRGIAAALDARGSPGEPSGRGDAAFRIVAAIAEW